MHLHIQYGMSGEILSRLLAKKLHGGFFLGHINQRSLHTIALENIAYSLICPAQDEAAIRSGLPKSLNQFTWIEMSGISGSYKICSNFGNATSSVPKNKLFAIIHKRLLICARLAQAWRLSPNTAQSWHKHKANPLR